MSYIPPPQGYEAAFRAEIREDIRSVLDRMRESRISKAADGETVENIRFPLETGEVFYVLQALGYKANRDTYRYLTQNDFLAKPRQQKDKRRLAWTEDDVVDFACELERRRLWLIGRHTEKKTAFELQDELDQWQKGNEEWQRQMEMPLADLLDEIARAEDEDERNGLAIVLHARVGERLLPETKELLTRLVKEEHEPVRKGIAEVLKGEVDHATTETD